MIPAWKNPDTGVWEPIKDNPTILRLDGEVRAPLAVIMAPSWTWAERWEYGVFELEYVAPPEGYAVVFTEYAFDGGKVRELHHVEKIEQVAITVGRVRHVSRGKS